MITFEKVSVKFTDEYRALDNVSFQVNKGEFIYVLGKSGAGKSTLLKLVYAAIVPSAGIVRVAQNDITMLSASRIPYLRRQIGLVLQDFFLLEDRTVFDNIRMALDVYYFKKSHTTDRIWKLLRHLGIFGLRDVIVKNLSGGEKQRVAIARAMVNDPLIVIADEPTGNLDTDNSITIMELLRSACMAGATVLMATHDINMVNMYPSRNITLDKGKLISDKIK